MNAVGSYTPHVIRARATVVRRVQSARAVPREGRCRQRPGRAHRTSTSELRVEASASPRAARQARKRRRLLAVDGFQRIVVAAPRVPGALRFRGNHVVANPPARSGHAAVGAADDARVVSVDTAAVERRALPRRRRTGRRRAAHAGHHGFFFVVNAVGDALRRHVSRCTT